jgi:hypothetical protein
MVGVEIDKFDLLLLIIPVSDHPELIVDAKIPIASLAFPPVEPR